MSGNPERYKLTLGDGVTTITGMFSAIFKELMDQKLIREHTLLRIDDYITNQLNDMK